MSSRVLTVAMNGETVGEWRRSAGGATEFQYAESWLNAPHTRAISLSLPLARQPYKGEAVYNFFDNLLPDNELIRSRIQQRFQTVTKSPFDLLSAIGQDCVGAIQLYQGESRSVRQTVAQPLNDQAIENLLKNYRTSPLGMNKFDDFRISLAGAQEKTALLWYQNQWQRPLHATATSHIFKLPIGSVGQGQLDLSDSCENEWLCLQILQKFGLSVPLASVARFGESKVLIVERFDRRWSADGSWLIRLPQEDMCQALNIAPARKYEADGGIGIVRIMQLLNGSANAKQDRKQFFKAQIVFWLLCAIDGHAKNFSLYLEPQNRYRLTPFYDVISAYPLISPSGLQAQKVKMAMAWQGENRHYVWQKIKLPHIFHTAKSAGLATETVEEILHELTQSYPSIDQIDTASLPLHIVEPILNGLRNKMKVLDCV
ncbi:type II toxin-antitoxin system HipA family toxin [Cricetibacter osteomyelitidis]|uniref:type II toxin-antitoxin system HipA family toxin n=1 Tax=Cricetibacter osteomyelitidis TaxID=1521931 RepID=UPI00311F19B7